MRNILVTSALVYANGPLHLGHILEQIQTDIWVRFQRLRGHRCLYLSGDDAHGTPIMIGAQKAGITPEELIAKMHQEHQRDSNGFGIVFDNYHSTHSEENQELTYLIYERLRAQGDLEPRVISQAFDSDAQIFLPDRYLRGTCPRCGATQQPGDNCDRCGATYSPDELIDPISILSGKPPQKKDSTHDFFLLPKYTDFLKEWGNHSLPAEVIHKLDEWFTAGLKAWDITRDAPYFGFAVPDQPQKYFYVWLDAPIGYWASLKNLSQQGQVDFTSYWQPDSEAELYHFIGKDIVYFHALFWPAILKSANIRLPTQLFVHGYLTVDGQKMSKSRGTFIRAQDYLRYLDPEYLRYYLAAKLNPGIEDIDLNFADFIQKNNSDLVGKIVNIASRSAKFINQSFAGYLSENLAEPQLFEHGIMLADQVATAYEARNFSGAVRLIISLADRVNQYIDEQKPWVKAKANPSDPSIQEICTVGINCYRLLIIMLKPILPVLAQKSEHFLQIPPLQWQDLQTPLLHHQIGEFQPLIQRVDPQAVKDLLACRPD